VPVVIRTYLELPRAAAFRPAWGDFPDLRVTREAPAPPSLYRMLYRTVGDLYAWRDRWDWSDSEIAAHLARPEVSLHVARRGDDIVGFYELLRGTDGIEIAYFGLLPAFVGRGLGKHLLSLAVREAFTLGQRVWLHTCTLDHPSALPNYLARGFVPYRTETYAQQ